MITIDLVSPVGGLRGGVENVIKSWTKHLNPELFNLRVFHMTPGTAYLEGYPKAFSLNATDHPVDLEFMVAAYELFLSQQGIPDICIAVNWPLLTKACHLVRQKYGLNYKLFSWVHTIFEAYEEAGRGGVEELLDADAHLAISGNIARHILVKKADAIVYLIGNPIEPIDSSDYQADPHTLAFIGRLDCSKNLDIVLEAMYRSRADWRLKIVGDGEIRQAVEGWISLLKLENQVEMLGWQDKPFDYVKDASALIVASEYEGFCMVAWEASSLGMTVISNPLAGIEDYLVEGQNGYYYQKEDAISLAKLLDALADGTISLCEASVCRKSVEAFLTPAYFQRVESILQESVPKE